jgi:hypothetical protein
MLVLAAVFATTIAMHPRRAGDTTPRTTQAFATGCPEGPGVAYRPGVRRCPALEISGRVGAIPSLDPVFNVEADTNALLRTERGTATLVGSTIDGRVLFTMPIDETGPFHVFVPLAPSAARTLARLRLITPVGVVDRLATLHNEPTAEAVSTGETTAILAWNARSFPAVRVATIPGGPFIAYGTGSGTYEQLDIHTDTNAVIVEFSDGLRSTTRVVRLFGR